MSCTDASDCTAVGNYGSGDDYGFYVTETAGTWGTPTAIPTAGGGFFTVRTMSCPDASDCTVIGATFPGLGYAGTSAYVSETAGTWSTPTQIPAPSSLEGEAFSTGVSCTDASNCTIVGYDGGSQPFYYTETAGTWGTPTLIPIPPGLPEADLEGVSCADASDCTAVGSTNTGTTYTEPLYSTETAGTWGTVTEVPFSATENDFFVGVSCADASDCTAVGDFESGQAGTAASSTGTGQPFYARESIPAVPKVSSVSPNAGPVTGGTAITITGTGFVPGALVEISQGYGPGPTAILATKVRVVSRTQIKATTGRATKAGRYAVFVLTPGGTNPTPPKAGYYTYKP